MSYKKGKLISLVSFYVIEMLPFFMFSLPRKLNLLLQSLECSIRKLSNINSIS